MMMMMDTMNKWRLRQQQQQQCHSCGYGVGGGDWNQYILAFFLFFGCCWWSKLFCCVRFGHFHSFILTWMVSLFLFPFDSQLFGFGFGFFLFCFCFWWHWGLFLICPFFYISICVRLTKYYLGMNNSVCVCVCLSVGKPKLANIKLDSFLLFLPIAY